MKEKTFDHILGNQIDDTSHKDHLLTQNILDGIIKSTNKSQLQKNRHIAVRLSMEDYLSANSPKIIRTGEFLNQLLEIYNINKSRFAEHISYGKTNLYALIAGRRKFNSKLAAKIGSVFSIDPELWLYIEAKNEMKSYVPKKEDLLRTVNLQELSHTN